MREGMKLEDMMERMKPSRIDHKKLVHFKDAGLQSEYLIINLWKDISKATGYFSLLPEERKGIGSYIIQLLKDFQPTLKVLNEEPCEDDLVVITCNGNSRHHYYDEETLPRNSAGSVGILHLKNMRNYYSESNWRITIPAFDGVFSVERDDALKIQQRQSPGTTIRTGDLVRFKGTGGADIGATIMTKYKFNEGWETPAQIDYDSRATLDLLQRDVEYLVFKKEGNNAILRVENVNIDVPLRYLTKQPGEPYPDFSEANRQTIRDFLERKGIIRKCGLFRQMLIEEARNKQNGLVKKLLGNNHDEYIRMCEALYYVARAS